MKGPERDTKHQQRDAKGQVVFQCGCLALMLERWGALFMSEPRAPLSHNLSMCIKTVLIMIIQNRLTKYDNLVTEVVLISLRTLGLWVP